MAETIEPQSEQPEPLADREVVVTAAAAVSPAHRSHSAPGRALGHEPRREGTFHRIIGFIGWVFTGFGLAHAFRQRGPSARDQMITVYSVHRAFFLWPLVVTGFIGAIVVNNNWLARHDAGTFMGWFYIAVLTYTLVSLLFDISTFRLLLWAGIFVFLFILVRFLEEKHKVEILPVLFGELHKLEPQLNYGFAVVMSWLLLFPWIGALFNTFTNGRKRFTPNEISEFHLGEGTELTDRTGMQFRTKYRDVFETVLGLGAGDLLAVDGTGVVRKRWENILFLAFIWPKMDEILHQRSATVDNTRNAPVEVEEVRPEPHRTTHQP